MSLFEKNGHGDFIRIDCSLLETRAGTAKRNPYVYGYGVKIPTSWEVKHNGRWKRVYCACFSNSGSCYILSKGKRYLVDGLGI